MRQSTAEAYASLECVYSNSSGHPMLRKLTWLCVGSTVRSDDRSNNEALNTNNLQRYLTQISRLRIVDLILRFIIGDSHLLRLLE